MKRRQFIKASAGAAAIPALGMASVAKENDIKVELKSGFFGGPVVSIKGGVSTIDMPTRMLMSPDFIEHNQKILGLKPLNLLNVFGFEKEVDFVGTLTLRGTIVNGEKKPVVGYYAKYHLSKEEQPNAICYNEQTNSWLTKFSSELLSESDVRIQFSAFNFVLTLPHNVKRNIGTVRYDDEVDRMWGLLDAVEKTYAMT